MTKILLLGGSGQVGREILDLMHDLPFSNHELSLTSFSSQAADITKADTLNKIFSELHPSCVINCAAYTAVDKAEADAERAFAVNRDGAAHLARLCSDYEAPMLHVSTDYVFDGEQATPYQETDATNPLSVYGESKWQGEQAVRDCHEQHIILRTSWVFGQYGNNFVKTMLRLGRERQELGIVTDQTGCPTPARSIAQTLLTICQAVLQGEKREWGTYHYCGIPVTSWFEFARHIFDFARQSSGMEAPRLNPIPTSAYPTPARRPHQSVLACDKITRVFGIAPADWQTELRNVIETLTSHKN